MWISLAWVVGSMLTAVVAVVWMNREIIWIKEDIEEIKKDLTSLRTHSARHERSLEAQMLIIQQQREEINRLHAAAVFVFRS